jgi:hypothetical protein
MMACIRKEWMQDINDFSNKFNVIFFILAENVSKHLYEICYEMNHYMIQCKYKEININIY